MGICVHYLYNRRTTFQLIQSVVRFLGDSGACLFCVVIYFVTDACLLIVVFAVVSHY